MTIAYRHYTDIDLCSLDNNLHFSLSILSYRPSRRWDLIRLGRVFSNITNTIVVAKTDSFYIVHGMSELWFFLEQGMYEECGVSNDHATRRMQIPWI
jgi:hypothetical protein